MDKRSRTHMKCAMAGMSCSFWVGVTNILTKASKFSMDRSMKACEKEHSEFKKLFDDEKPEGVKTEG